MTTYRYNLDLPENLRHRLDVERRRQGYTTLAPFVISLLEEGMRRAPDHDLLMFTATCIRELLIRDGSYSAAVHRMNSLMSVAQTGEIIVDG